MKDNRVLPNFNQVAQNGVDNPLEIQSEVILKNLKAKCKKHPKRNADYLHLVSDVENIRICNMCIVKNDIPNKDYLDIRELL